MADRTRSLQTLGERLGAIVRKTADSLEPGDSVVIEMRVRVGRVGFEGGRSESYTIDREWTTPRGSSSFRVESGTVEVDVGGSHGR